MSLLLCLQAFAFGVVAPYSEATFMPIALGIVALFHILICSLWHNHFRWFMKTTNGFEDGINRLDSLFFGFASLYVLTEFNFDEDGNTYWITATREKKIPKIFSYKRYKKRDDNVGIAIQEPTSATGDRIQPREGRAEKKPSLLKYRTTWRSHLFFDFVVFWENLALGLCAYNISDEAFSAFGFILTFCSMHVLGNDYINLLGHCHLLVIELPSFT